MSMWTKLHVRLLEQEIRQQQDRCEFYTGRIERGVADDEDRVCLDVYGKIRESLINLRRPEDKTPDEAKERAEIRNAIRALSCDMNLLGVLSAPQLRSYAVGYISSCCKRTLGKIPLEELIVEELASVS